MGLWDQKRKKQNLTYEKLKKKVKHHNKLLEGGRFHGFFSGRLGRIAEKKGLEGIELLCREFLINDSARDKC